MRKTWKMLFIRNLGYGTGGMRGKLELEQTGWHLYVKESFCWVGGFYNGSRQDTGIQRIRFRVIKAYNRVKFAVRHLHGFAGIVVTASHNPPEYNGYKVYGPDGGQLPPSKGPDQNIAQRWTRHTLNYFRKLKYLRWNRHQGCIYAASWYSKSTAMALAAMNYKHVAVGKEQEQPALCFPLSPVQMLKNMPRLSWPSGKAANWRRYLIATDPDADRLGIAVKNENGEYTVLTGNQTEPLLLHYILTQIKRKEHFHLMGSFLKRLLPRSLGGKLQPLSESKQSVY